MQFRKRSALQVGLALALASPAVMAEVADFDVQALPAPTSPSPFLSLENSRALGHRNFAVGARISYLRSPLELRLPAASPDGTRTLAVSDLLAAEVLMAGGLTPHFDVGLNLPLRLFQSGSGASAVGEQSSLPSPALGAPRLSLARAWDLPAGIRLRPHAVLVLPLGTKNAFTGGATTKGELGVALGYGETLEVTLDVTALLQETATFGNLRSGSGMRLGFGSSYRVDETWSVAAEAVVLPFVLTQLESDEYSSGTFLPAEVVASGRFRTATGLFGLSLGTGLPLSRTSSLTGESAVRGPSSPTVRAALEYRYLF